MHNARRNRDRKPGRRVPFRDPKPVILIVCEGKNTEPEYLEGFMRSCQNPRVTIELCPDHGVPRTLVKIAKKHKAIAQRTARREGDDNLAFDSVWCVFDVDDHPNLADAICMARDNDIELAVSNPSFELWLLLHFRDSPGMQDRIRIREMVTAFVGNYDKHVDFKLYATGYPQAVLRAERLAIAAQEVEEAGRNPTTGVYRLTESISKS